jgi:hypothetical protein
MFCYVLIKEIITAETLYAHTKGGFNLNKTMVSGQCIHWKWGLVLIILFSRQEDPADMVWQLNTNLVRTTAPNESTCQPSGQSSNHDSGQRLRSCP